MLARRGLRHSVQRMTTSRTENIPTFRTFIDGTWVASQSGHTFENRNPADQDDLIGYFQQSSPDDARAAIQAARRAYDTWRTVPAPRRAEMLFAAARLIA